MESALLILETSELLHDEGERALERESAEKKVRSKKKTCSSPGGRNEECEAKEPCARWRLRVQTRKQLEIQKTTKYHGNLRGREIFKDKDRRRDRVNLRGRKDERDKF